MMRLFLLGACAVGLLALTSVAGAGVIIEHVDNVDPATEGWYFDKYGSCTVGADDGPPLNWKITCGNRTYGRYRYRTDEGLTAADFQDPTGWTSTVRMQFNYGGREEGGQMRNTATTGVRVAGWTWDDDVDDDPLTEDPDIFIAGHGDEFALGGAVDPTDGFHYYQIVYDPVDFGNPNDDVVTWYLDGTSVHSALASELIATTGVHYYFGDGNSHGGASEAQFALARLETGQHPYSPEELIPGDANGDDVVNDADASILAAHWQQPGGWSDGDFNNDNVVNDQDASIMAAHWGETREGAAPVPEPSVLVLLAGGLLWLLVRRARP